MSTKFVHGPLDGDVLLRALPLSGGWVVESGGRGFPQIVHPEQPTVAGTPAHAEVLRYHDAYGFAHYYMWSYDQEAYLYLHQEDLDGQLAPFGTVANSFPVREEEPKEHDQSSWNPFWRKTR